jgi:hypothetical protein
MSKNVSFIKTPEEIAAFRNAGVGNDRDWFRDCTGLWLAYLIDQKLYEKLLPPPLEPVGPIAWGFIGVLGTPVGNIYTYKEGGLFLFASYKNRVGGYCLSMPTDGREMGTFMGRELYSYPKKLSNIVLRRNGDECYGSIERNGVKFIEIKGTIGTPNEPEMYAKMLPAPEIEVPSKSIGLLIDYKLKCPGEDVFHFTATRFTDVQLIAHTSEWIAHTCEDMRIEVTLRESEDDPWAELTPVKVLGARWQTYKVRLFGSTTLKEYTDEEVEALEPYLWNRYDTQLFGKPHLEF